jgi:hypothetical protein
VGSTKQPQWPVAAAGDMDVGALGGSGGSGGHAPARPVWRVRDREQLRVWYNAGVEPPASAARRQPHPEIRNVVIGASEAKDDVRGREGRVRRDRQLRAGEEAAAARRRLRTRRTAADGGGVRARARVSERRGLILKINM